MNDGWNSQLILFHVCGACLLLSVSACERVSFLFPSKQSVCMYVCVCVCVKVHVRNGWSESANRSVCVRPAIAPHTCLGIPEEHRTDVIHCCGHQTEAWQHQCAQVLRGPPGSAAAAKSLQHSQYPCMQASACNQTHSSRSCQRVGN